MIEFVKYIESVSYLNERFENQQSDGIWDECNKRGVGDRLCKAITACSFHFTLVDRHFAAGFGPASTIPVLPQHVVHLI